jgi:endonuclease III
MKHIIFLWLFTVNSYALDCPQENSSTPLCPTSGSTMLDDTYPVQSFVISDSATGDKTAETSKVPARFIENIFDSYFNSEFENMPQVILSVQTEDDHKRIVEEVREKLKSKKINETEIEKAIKQITFRKAVAYTWQ